MRKNTAFAVVICFTLSWFGASVVSAQAAQPVSEKPASVLDEVTLKNGSRILGEVASLNEGVLTIKSAFAAVDDVVKVKWSEVADIKTSPARVIPIVIEDGTPGGTRVNGTIAGVQGTNLSIRTNIAQQPLMTVAMSSVKRVNIEDKPITFTGNFGLGVSISDGNANNRTASLFGNFEARSERQRLTLRGNYNYADNDAGVTLRNGLAAFKYDFFITKRLFVYASALFEYDGFQDLALRSALSVGPGYQFIDKGDFAGESFREMQLYAEAGLAYFSENHRRAPDDEFVSGRWAVKFDWPILPKQVTLFHQHEGYPGLERAKDLYITTQQGVRFNLWQGLVATFQLNWRWDNTPTPGFGRSDTLYLATIGYSFDI